MAKKYSVLYQGHKGNAEFLDLQMYDTREEAEHNFKHVIELLRTDYDGFSYVALMRNNSCGEWDVVQYADNEGGCYAES